MALQNNTSLKPVITLQSRPSVDRTGLYTNHVLVSVLWLEIADCLCSFLPWVPDDSVCQVISGDVDDGLAFVEDRGRVLLQRLVDTVDCAFELELVAGRVVLGCVEDLVGVSYASETGDGGLGDVLALR